MNNPHSRNINDYIIPPIKSIYISRQLRKKEHVIPHNSISTLALSQAINTRQSHNKLVSPSQVTCLSTTDLSPTRSNPGTDIYNAKNFPDSLLQKPKIPTIQTIQSKQLIAPGAEEGILHFPLISTDIVLDNDTVEETPLRNKLINSISKYNIDIHREETQKIYAVRSSLSRQTNQKLKSNIPKIPTTLHQQHQQQHDKQQEQRQGQNQQYPISLSSSVPADPAQQIHKHYTPFPQSIDDYASIVTLHLLSRNDPFYGLVPNNCIFNLNIHNTYNTTTTTTTRTRTLTQQLHSLYSRLDLHYNIKLLSQKFLQLSTTNLFLAYQALRSECPSVYSQLNEPPPSVFYSQLLGTSLLSIPYWDANTLETAQMSNFLWDTVQIDALFREITKDFGFFITVPVQCNQSFGVRPTRFSAAGKLSQMAPQVGPLARQSAASQIRSKYLQYEHVLLTHQDLILKTVQIVRLCKKKVRNYLLLRYKQKILEIMNQVVNMYSIYDMGDDAMVDDIDDSNGDGVDGEGDQKGGNENKGLDSQDGKSPQHSQHSSRSQQKRDKQDNQDKQNTQNKTHSHSPLNMEQLSIRLSQLETKSRVENAPDSRIFNLASPQNGMLLLAYFIRLLPRIEDKTVLTENNIHFLLSPPFQSMKQQLWSDEENSTESKTAPHNRSGTISLSKAAEILQKRRIDALDQEKKLQIEQRERKRQRRGLVQGQGRGHGGGKADTQEQEQEQEEREQGQESGQKHANESFHLGDYANTSPSNNIKIITNTSTDISLLESILSHLPSNSPISFLLPSYTEAIYELSTVVCAPFLLLTSSDIEEIENSEEFITLKLKLNQMNQRQYTQSSKIPFHSTISTTSNDSNNSISSVYNLEDLHKISHTKNILSGYLYELFLLSPSIYKQASMLYSMDISPNTIQTYEVSRETIEKLRYEQLLIHRRNIQQFASVPISLYVKDMLSHSTPAGVPTTSASATMTTVSNHNIYTLSPSDLTSQLPDTTSTIPLLLSIGLLAPYRDQYGSNLEIVLERDIIAKSSHPQQQQQQHSSPTPIRRNSFNSNPSSTNTSLGTITPLQSPSKLSLSQSPSSLMTNVSSEHYNKMYQDRIDRKSSLAATSQGDLRKYTIFAPNLQTQSVAISSVRSEVFTILSRKKEGKMQLRELYDYCKKETEEKIWKKRATKELMTSTATPAATATATATATEPLQNHAISFSLSPRGYNFHIRDLVGCGLFALHQLNSKNKGLKLKILDKALQKAIKEGFKGQRKGGKGKK